MPGQLRSTLALLSCLVALVLAAPAQADPSWAEQRLMERMNDARASYGLRQLRFASNLAQGASAWSERLVRRDALRHAKLPAGTGEIIAWGTCDWFRPKRAVQMWLNSPGHRALLLRGGFRVVGTGWTRGSWRSYGCVEMAVARFR